MSTWEQNNCDHRFTPVSAVCAKCGWYPPSQATPAAPGGVECAGDVHRWADEADAEGDTCQCGNWYRFSDRIERTPQ